MLHNTMTTTEGTLFGAFAFMKREIFFRQYEPERVDPLGRRCSLPCRTRSWQSKPASARGRRSHQGMEGGGGEARGEGERFIVAAWISFYIKTNAAS